ncbi:hypothetical protein BK788_14645 [Bacillus thuringiensis serovar sinensis]|nr:hypothetical protein BK788_14645 [Bacillus thuringiensis serovar sinensis]
MENHSEHKIKKILAVTATLTMLATGIVSSSDVFAEEPTQQKSLLTALQNGQSVKAEDRVFAVQEKGIYLSFKVLKKG